MKTSKILGIASLTLALFSQAFALDDFVGEYKGEIRGQKGYPYDNNFEMCAQISKHKDGYRLRLIPELLKRCEDELLLNGLKAQDGKIVLTEVGKWKLSGEITPDEIVLEGVQNGQSKPVIKLKKFDRKSDTLGEKAPKGAVVLFDGTNTKAWTNKRGLACTWEMMPDGAMKISRKNAPSDEEKRKEQSIVTKQAFNNFRLHVEFMTPDYWQKDAQYRGNSGIFIGPYEAQVLDSFGSEGYWNECGSIYRILPPQVNSVLPPEKWQTYDIYFKGAVYEGNKLVKRPVVSIYLNGVKVQDNVEIPHGTNTKQSDRAKFRHPRPPYKIELQDHNDAVQYRNIWLLEEK